MSETTTTRPRKSRTSKAADKAEQDQSQPEQDQPQDQQPEPEPAEPFAAVTAETYPKIFYKPVVKVTMPGGETVETIAHCEHMDRYGHESEKAAMVCARKIAAQRGLKIK